MSASRNRTIILVLTLALLAFLAWQFATLIFYVFTAVILSLLGRPILKLLDQVKIKQWDLPEALKAVLTLLTLFGLITLLFTLFLPPLIEQTRALEKVNVEAIARGLEEPIAWAEDLARRYELTEADLSLEAYLRAKVLSVVDATRISNIAGAIVGFTGDFFIAAFSVIFITFFFLKERKLPHQIMLVLTPDPYVEQVQNIIATAKPLLTRYFVGVVIEVLLVGGLISLGLSLVGVDNALVIGFLAGLFNVIPYVGPIIGATLGVILTTLGSLNLDFYSGMVPLILKALAVFAVVQLIDNFVFQPLIYSNSVKAHPLEVFLVILMAGTLAGVGGMILAIPAYTMFRVVAREFFNQFKIIQSLTRSL